MSAKQGTQAMAVQNDAVGGGKPLPTYAQLRQRTDAPPGSSWGLFSHDAQRGMANFASAPQVLQAAASIVEGRVFNLDYALDAFLPALFPERHAYHHEVFQINKTVKDDYLDKFFLQGTSQIDALRHVKDFVHGYYQGIPESAIVAGAPELGIQLWAEKPVVGRAVLIDLEGAALSAGKPIDHASGPALGFDLLQQAMELQRIELRHGDIVLLNTGWSAWYLGLDEDARADVRKRAVYTGVYPQIEILAWLWDKRISFLGSDTVSVEVFPAPPDPPLLSDSVENRGRLHGQWLARLGILLGELWKLDELAAHSRDTGRSDAFITIKPLNLVGGVGSPPNAVAVR
jgi:kynurenine formamidase